MRGLVHEAGVEGVGDLPAAVREVVRQTQIELLPLRRGLRHMRRRIGQEVDRLGRTLTALNLLAWPGLALGRRLRPAPAAQLDDDREPRQFHGPVDPRTVEQG